MQMIPPYGMRSNYSTVGLYPTAAYPITTLGNASSSNPLISSIKGAKVRTPTDLSNVVIMVLDSIALETGFKESQEKKVKISQDALKADTTAKKVSIMQRLSELTKKRNAVRTNDAIRNGFAYEFYCNVEKPGICAKKTEPEIKLEVAKKLEIPFYKRPIVYVPSAVFLTFMLYRKFIG